jgi:Flp pilus assembly protein TadG
VTRRCRSGWPRGPDQSGQSTVELALGLPFVIVLLLAIVQIGLVARDQILVVHAAREAARVSAVEPGEDGPRAAAVESSLLDPSRMQVDVGPRGDAGSRVSVTVRYRCPTLVPLVGPLIDDVEVRATATMRVEG